MKVTKNWVSSSPPCSRNSKKQKGAMCEQNITEENFKKEI